MRAVSSKLARANGEDNLYLCVIVSETNPTSLTLTGADVDGLNDDDRIAAGSVLITPSKNYVAFVDGTFKEKA